MPLMRIPYTDPLPAPRILPASASTYEGAVAALAAFLTGASQLGDRPPYGSGRQAEQKHSQARFGVANRPAAAGQSPPHAVSHGLDRGRISRAHRYGKSILLTGAGVSVASGLADYRGRNGTYTLNKTYRPIYYHEFIAQHDARKRYWARSFLGWTNMLRARPNSAHYAIRDLGASGHLESVITQSE